MVLDSLFFVGWDVDTQRTPLRVNSIHSNEGRTRGGNVTVLVLASFCIPYATSVFRFSKKDRLNKSPLLTHSFGNLVNKRSVCRTGGKLTFLNQSPAAEGVGVRRQGYCEKCFRDMNRLRIYKVKNLKRRHQHKLYPINRVKEKLRMRKFRV